MLPRSIVMGFFVLAGSSLLTAADPLIPPAPTGNGTSFVPAVPPPPAPHLPGATLPPVPAPAAGTPLTPPKTIVPREPVPAATIPASPPAVSPPASSMAPIPEGVPPGPVQGTLTAPTPVLPAAPYSQSSPPVSNGWIVSPADSYSYPGVPAGTVWGDPQGFATGFPPYNTFATQPNVVPDFHTGPAGGEHARFPYYSYRRPWYTPGPVSRNVNIVW